MSSPARALFIKFDADAEDGEFGTSADAKDSAALGIVAKDVNRAEILGDILSSRSESRFGTEALDDDSTSATSDLISGAADADAAEG